MAIANKQVARQFVSEQLVGRGMIADFAIHQPDKEDGGIPNPHFHVLCPIRPIEPDGKWGCKQRCRYRLDEDGNRIMGEDGKPLFDAVPTTDWGSPETLEHWREAWAAMVNAKFEEKGLICRIDHRSYERQGLDLLPTVHEGVAVHQIQCVFDVLSENDLSQYKVMMYMNFYDFQHYQRCETTYYGYMEHYDTLSDINLTNQDSPMEKASCKVLAAYLDAPAKWGLWTGVSSRPIMPIATKILLSKTPLTADAELVKRLKISREDVRLLKLYNMLPVT